MENISETVIQIQFSLLSKVFLWYVQTHYTVAPWKIMRCTEIYCFLSSIKTIWYFWHPNVSQSKLRFSYEFLVKKWSIYRFKSYTCKWNDEELILRLCVINVQKKPYRHHTNVSVTIIITITFWMYFVVYLKSNYKKRFA